MKKLLLFIIHCPLFIALCACDLTQDYRTGDNSQVPSHLKKVSYSQLTGWRDDDVRYALQAFRNTCKAKIQYTGKIVPDKALLEEKCSILPAASADAKVVRAWFESHFQPYQLRDEKGAETGTFTGYYSPVVKACRTKTAACPVPIMNKPADGQNYKGVDSKTLVKNRIGRVIYWIDPIDLQDMGAATLVLEDGKQVKVVVTSTNDLPFNGIGSQLQKRGIRPPEGYGMKSVRKYLKEHRVLAQELIDNNPRYVYYAETDSMDVKGNMGVKLSKIRSIAVDNSLHTLGLPVYVDTNLTDGRKFRRLMVAQDTGGAIKGWVRADIYFGEGDSAFELAHGQHTQGKMYVLMPKEYSN